MSVSFNLMASRKQLAKQKKDSPMIQFNRKRLPFLAAGLAVALGYMPALGEDKTPTSPTSPTTRTPASADAKQVTLTGKVVDLHQFMTGERSQSRSPVGTSIDRDNATDRNKTPGTTPGSDTTRTPGSDTKITDRDTKATDRDNKYGDKHHASGNNESQIMGLQTSTGLVLICFQDDKADGIKSGQDQGRTVAPAQPGDQTRPTPRTPGTTPGTTTPGTPTTRDNDADKTIQADKSRMKDGASWVDKQVSVTGTMYEKHGIKYLLVSKISSSLSTSPSTQDSATTLPRPQ